MDIEDICFLDTETKALPGVSASDGDVTKSGTYRYHRHARPIILTYAIGMQPVRCAAVSSFDGFCLPIERDFLDFCYRVDRGEAWFAAWNAGFDRGAVSNIWGGDEPFAPETFLDIMAQATASNLPPSLEGAARAIGREGKRPEGKRLIKLFCAPGATATPQSHPKDWALFLDYGVQDTDLLRDVFLHTRPLPLEEWREYWASERINDRGVAVDVPLAEAASAVALADRERTNAMLTRYTNGQITSIYQHDKLKNWVWDQLQYSEARNILVTDYIDEDVEGEDEDVKTVELSLERDRVTRLIAYLQQLPQPLSARDETILRVMQLREFGASQTPKKFDKIIAQHVDGKLLGQYVFNGAAQTGRFSAKGVQIHNLTRSTLGKHEVAAIEMLNSLLED